MTLPLTQVETFYDRMANAIDQSSEPPEVFLAKFALALAHRCGDLAMIDDAFAACADQKPATRAARLI